MHKLTAQQFTAIVSSLEKIASATDSDKRQFTRMDVETQLRLAPIVDGNVAEPIVALSRNVSPVSVGVNQRMRMNVGDKFVLSLPCGKEAKYVVCTVVYCRLIAEGIHAMGATFDEEAKPAQIAVFQKSVPATAAPSPPAATAPAPPAAKK